MSANLATLGPAVLFGLATAAGLLLIVAGLRRRNITPATAPAPAAAARPSALARWYGPDASAARRRLGIAVVASIVAAAITGWPVGGLLAGVAAWGMPRALGPDRDAKKSIARIEAIATWTESLRDTLAAAAGLEQAITVSAATAPEPIEGEVTRLAARIRTGTRLPIALHQFARELADPTGDLVVAALLIASQRHARNLADLLGTLAVSAREQAALRMRVAAARARHKTSTRMIVATTAGMASFIVVANRDYLDPYNSASGQLMLLVIGGVFGLGFWLLARMSKIGETVRLLADPAEAPTTSPQAVAKHEDRRPRPAHAGTASLRAVAGR